MELKIIESLRQRSSVTFDLLECFEPGDVQFRLLERVDFGVPTSLHHASFSASTNLLRQFDLITMFHVHYYWKHREERRLVMQALLKQLKPLGMVFILLLEEVISIRASVTYNFCPAVRAYLGPQQSNSTEG